MAGGAAAIGRRLDVLPFDEMIVSSSTFATGVANVRSSRRRRKAIVAEGNALGENPQTTCGLKGLANRCELSGTKANL